MSYVDYSDPALRHVAEGMSFGKASRRSESSKPNPLRADRALIECYIRTLYRYADLGSYVSLRAFHQVTRSLTAMAAVKLKGTDPLQAVIDAAVDKIDMAVTDTAVFAPPLATFNNPSQARVVDIVNGLTVSVELDSDPTRGDQLVALLGPPTMVVFSGGDWISPSGELVPKRHYHWRLSVPTRTIAEHAQLRQLRELAARLTGADLSGVPLVHPFRGAGGWHLKNPRSPRLTTIAAFDDTREIALLPALHALEEAIAAAGLARPPRQQSAPEDPTGEWATWLTWVDLPTTHQEWVLVVIATARSCGCADEGLAALDAWCQGSEEHYNRAGLEKTWDWICQSITAEDPNDDRPRAGAGTLAELARRGGYVPGMGRREGSADSTQGRSENAHYGNSTSAAEEPDNDGLNEADIPKPFGWPAPMGRDAYYGVVGEFADLVAPHTEADPNALIFSILTTLGNMLGLRPHMMAESDEHPGRLYSLIIGFSSKSRKGSAQGRVNAFAREVDPNWFRLCATTTSLTTGEGLINQVRDERSIIDPDDDDKRKIVDEGVDDKRKLIIQTEFAAVLRKMAGPNDSLNAMLRHLFDHSTAGTGGKSSPQTTTGAHISVVGHITLPEFRLCLAPTDISNGFINRFGICCAYRSKFLPRGGGPILWGELAERVRRAVERGAAFDELVWSDAAGALWDEVYLELSAERPGPWGEATSRAEVQVLRYAVIYAVLDGSRIIHLDHLRAALEVWRYASDSAKFVFGTELRNPDANKILAALREAGAKGMGQTEISNLLCRNANKQKLREAFRELVTYRLVRSATRKELGAKEGPKTMWFAV